MVERCAHRQIVPGRKVGFKEQLGVAVFLRYVVKVVSETVIGFVPRAVEHEGDAGIMFVLKHNGVFPLRFVAFGVGFRVVMRCFGGVVVGHAPLAFIVEDACRQLGNKPWRNVGPAVHEIVLAHLGHVHEAVAVGIVARLPVFKMEQEAGGQ